jgi:hypothetical protein
VRHLLVAGFALAAHGADECRVGVVADVEGVALDRLDRVHLVIELARVKRMRADPSGDQGDRDQSNPSEPHASILQRQPHRLLSAIN